MTHDPQKPVAQMTQEEAIAYAQRVDQLLAEALRERDEARMDSERLDWLELHHCGLNHCDNPGGPHVWVGWERYYPKRPVDHFYGPNYRAAIDAARKGST